MGIIKIIIIIINSNINDVNVLNKCKCLWFNKKNGKFGIRSNFRNFFDILAHWEFRQNFLNIGIGKISEFESNLCV